MSAAVQLAPQQIIAGTIRIDLSRVARALEQAAVMARHTREEPGNIAYAFTLDQDEPGVLRVFEHYDSLDAVLFHFASDHMETFREEMKTWGITDLALRRYAVSDEGRPRPPIESATV